MPLAFVATEKNLKSAVVETVGELTKSKTSIISAIPTHIITGFLGVGKSTAILHLLKNKPDDERWAVLVNEFGEIGVDGNLFQGQHRQEQGVFIREVPGGCMCCTAGLPMQVALNQLLKLAKPDRLLIEPTGLGHPKEVLQSLTVDSYRDVIDVQKIVTLVDARKLSDSRYTEHHTFNEQIAIADIVVGNKQDLYQSDEQAQLDAYVKSHGSSDALVVFTENGDITAIDLFGRTAVTAEKPHHHHHHSAEVTPSLSDVAIPKCGYIKAINEGEGFYSIGWRFSGSQLFNYETLFSFLKTIKAERMKAVFITDKGAFSYNLTSDALTENVIGHCVESRIEIIASQINDDWEGPLMECIAP
ncbi:MAG: G3E family GTPase [Cellvibrionaceae bacterium]|jgi:G3E family GTPase